MRSFWHIALGATLASPAAALTPVPLCSGTPVSGKFAVWDAQNAEGGFVLYNGEHEDDIRVLSVLEHCASGRAVTARGQWDVDDARPDHAENVRDALEDFVFSPKAYTYRQIVSGLKKRGIKARTTTLKTESCGCSVFYPDQRGTRTPYK